MPDYWEKETDSHIFFYGGVLSNLYRTEFFCELEKDGEIYKFISSKQYMIAAKAHLFGDYDSLDRILETVSPSELKMIGRKIKNFSDEVWLPQARNIVYNGCFDKFYQNDKLFSILLSSDNKILVEADPIGTVWGIGRPITDYKIIQPNHWRGKNWLGQVLMKVRSDLCYEECNQFTDLQWDLD